MVRARDEGIGGRRRRSGGAPCIGCTGGTVTAICHAVLRACRRQDGNQYAGATRVVVHVQTMLALIVVLAIIRRIVVVMMAMVLIMIVVMAMMDMTVLIVLVDVKQTRENAPAGAAKAMLMTGARANASASAQMRATQRRLALFNPASMVTSRSHLAVPGRPRQGSSWRSLSRVMACQGSTLEVTAMRSLAIPTELEMNRSSAVPGAKLRDPQAQAGEPVCWLSTLDTSGSLRQPLQLRHLGRRPYRRYGIIILVCVR